MAITSVILLCLLSVNEIAFRGANSAIEQNHQYQNEMAVANQLVQGLLKAEGQLKSFIASHEAASKQQFELARAHVHKQLLQLESQLQRNAQELGEFSLLQTQVNDSLQAMQQLLDVYQEEGSTAQQAALDDYLAAQSILKIQRDMALYQAAQSAQIESTNKKTAFFLRLSQLGVALVSLASLLIFFLFLRRIKAEREAQHIQHLRLEAEQARLEGIMQQRTTALFMLTSHLQDVREEERAALAQELHDELGALITVAKLDVSSLKQIIAALPEENDPQIQDKLLRLQENMVQIFAVKRGIIDRLFPSTLASLGIKDALNLMVQQFSTAAGIEVDLQIDDGIALPEKTELMLYRVTQEALNNISKYAEATQVQVLLSHNPSSQLVTLVIEDNGKGFAVDEVPSTTYGIKGMKHRAQALGAKWDIRSSRLGTRICIEVQGVAAS